MGDIIQYDFGYEDRVVARTESIVICPSCDSEAWMIILKNADDSDQKIVAYECEDCGWRVNITPVDIHKDAIVT